MDPKVVGGLKMMIEAAWGAKFSSTSPRIAPAGFVPSPHRLLETRSPICRLHDEPPPPRSLRSAHVRTHASSFVVRAPRRSRFRCAPRRRPRRAPFACTTVRRVVCNGDRRSIQLGVVDRTVHRRCDTVRLASRDEPNGRALVRHLVRVSMMEAHDLATDETKLNTT